MSKREIPPNHDRLYHHEENRAERLLRQELSRRGLDFNQGMMIEGHEFDFYLPRYFLVIEVDGLTHLATATRERDLVKEAILRRLGLNLLRLDNGDVLRDVRACGRRVSDYIVSWEQKVGQAMGVRAEGPLQIGLRAWVSRFGRCLPDDDGRIR